VAEITLSLVLLAGAGLLIQSIANFATAPLGFVPDGLLTMTLSLPPVGYAKPEQRTALYDQITNRVLALPGVAGVGMSTHVALRGSNGVSAVTVEGRPPSDAKTAIFDTEQQFITDGYFRVMGILFQRGREFESADRAGAPLVAVVNNALVRKYFPHEDPIGKHIRCPGDEVNPWLTIVGVSGDEKQSSPFHQMAWTDPPIVDRPLAQNAGADVDLVVRVSSPRAPRAATVQKEILKLGSELRISDVYLMQHVLDRYTAYPRFRAILMGAFAGVALLLAIVGLYGVLSQLVVQRTQEIGIRIALGAQGRDILRLIMQQGMRVVGIGAGLGILAALSLGRFLQSLLYGVQPEDPITLAGVSLILLLAAVFATYVPARRAVRVNPIDSLRAE
jgi:putative ABC transport system permease protein